MHPRELEAGCGRGGQWLVAEQPVDRVLGELDARGWAGGVGGDDAAFLVDRHQAVKEVIERVGLDGRPH